MEFYFKSVANFGCRVLVVKYLFIVDLFKEIIWMFCGSF